MMKDRTGLRAITLWTCLAGGLFLCSPKLAEAGSDGCLRLAYADVLDWQEYQHPQLKAPIELAVHNGIENLESLYGRADIIYDDSVYGILLRTEGSDCLTHVFADYGTLVDLCQDRESGKVHQLIRRGAGRQSMIDVWSVDQTSTELVRHYSEEWFDSYKREGTRDRWKFVFVGADGRCKWKERRAKLEAAERILGTLKAGHVDGEGLRGSTLLPVRPIADDVARQSLVALEGKAVIEGAVYASEDDRADWRVFQILDDILCERDGVTLVHNRRSGDWYSIYDVKPTGCALYWPSYDLYGMQVIDGELHTSTCCLGQRSRDTFAIDLSSWRVRVVPDTVAVDMDANPIITDIKRAAFEE